MITAQPRTYRRPLDTPYLTEQGENFQSLRTSEREIDDDMLREAARVALNGSDDQWTAFLKLLPMIGVTASRSTP